MKKLMVMAMLGLGALAANADCTWSWWVGDDKAASDQRGCALGLATERAKVSGAQVALLWNRAKAFAAGAQVSFGYNRVDTFRNGCQVGTVCAADSSSLQLGLICANKTGFLPYFVFFNFDPKMFGAAK